MCGIFMQTAEYRNGFIAKELDCLKANAFINGYRGIDSTGMFVLANNQKNYQTIKSLGSVLYLLGSDRWDDFEKVALAKGQLIIGHGRAATKGTVNLDNAHPHVAENDKNTIVLVHNGTLHLNQRLPDFHKFDNDSKWMAEQILNLGEDEVLSKINGPIAAVWWNKSEQRIYFFRNSERPLHFARLKSGEMILNSEAPAIMWLNWKFNLGIKFEDIKEFKSEHLYWIPTKDTRTPLENRPIARAKSFRAANDHYPDYYGEIGAHSTGIRARSHYGSPAINGFVKHKMTDDIEKIFEGEILSIQYTAEGNKMTTLNSGDVLSTQEGPPEPLLFELYLSDTFPDMLCKKYYFRPDAKNLRNRGYSMVYINKTDFEPKDGPSGGPAAITSDVPKILLPGPRPDTEYKFASEEVAAGVIPRPLNVVKFSALDGATQKQVYNRGLCDDLLPRFLTAYNNNVSGTYMPGDRVVIESFAYEPLALNTNNRGYRVTGGLITPNVPSLGTVDAIFFDYDHSEEMLQKIGFFVGEINNIALALKHEYDKNGAKVIFNLRNVKPLSEIAEEEIKEIHKERSRTFKEACKKSHKLRLEREAQRREAAVLSYPGIEE